MAETDTPDGKALTQTATPLAGRPSDDCVLPFHAERAHANGRVIKLGTTVNEILTRHNYPDPVSELLAQAIALTGLLGSALKFDGKFILQTNSDGPVGLIVVDYETPGKLRGYASYNQDKLNALQNEAKISTGDLLGKGHLAMTVDQGPDMERYQGIVALEGQPLEEAAHTYFKQSEQLPTFLKLAVAKHYTTDTPDHSGQTSWRAGGLLVQNLTPEGGALAEDEETGAALEPMGSDDENWTRAKTLAETIEHHELLDPTLAPERLLYRLFHEENVRAFDSKVLEVYCSCSRQRVETLLQQFSAENLKDMVVDDQIVAKCEFCNTEYKFDFADYA